MATRRRKSINDIRNQEERLVSEAYTRLSQYPMYSKEWQAEYDKAQKRITRVRSSANSYVNSIRSTKAYKRTTASSDKGLSKYARDPFEALSLSGLENVQKANDVKFSPKTYTRLRMDFNRGGAKARSQASTKG